ncbi:hypothetical protein Esi_0370_0030 [Ectocarpus siliculosus]|uniref:Uncharacterized protein n=1 Tax=Ectocarpus siliculosus TaxID=2880 RepID=D8LLT7_ECTSI|nr:hypothetical protein Esi_0370_0030 [Ectocarpus siliculosus]|eukprot:CBN76173.1 hypothetical protein Esi_0370_0030 [Ectocarpus siliculosus]
MSAHFDGGAEIAGRRLREVEVSYVDDPTLDMGAEDSDDCPASPPPTYYLRVREENKRGTTGGGNGGDRDDDAEQHAAGNFPSGPRWFRSECQHFRHLEEVSPA